ncbi:RING finger protein 222 [Phaethornis superciliosus]
MSETSSNKEGTPAECPVCYEKFPSLEATHRRLSCGHTFCHDCLVKCLLSTKLDGQIQNSISCPVCRYVTFLSKKKALWSPKASTNPRTLEMPLSPSSLSQLTKTEASNTLVVPSHFVMPVQSLERCRSPVGWQGELVREAHIFVISDRGMPLVDTDCGSLGRRNGSETRSSLSLSSSMALGVKCCQSPIALAVFLILTLAMLAAVLPWLLLVKRDS